MGVTPMDHKGRISTFGGNDKHLIPWNLLVGCIFLTAGGLLAKFLLKKVSQGDARIKFNEAVKAYQDIAQNLCQAGVSPNGLKWLKAKEAENRIYKNQHAMLAHFSYWRHKSIPFQEADRGLSLLGDLLFDEVKNYKPEQGIRGAILPDIYYHLEQEASLHGRSKIADGLIVTTSLALMWPGIWIGSKISGG